MTVRYAPAFPIPFPPLDSETRVHDLSSLGGFFSPHVDEALQALSAALPADLRPGDALGESLRGGLNREYYELTHRVLIAHYKLIENSVPFAAYAAALREEAPRRHIFGCYPVLRQWMEDLRTRWVSNAGELLSNLERDRADLVQLVPGLGSGVILEHIQFGAGDPHLGGKSVAILHFAGGARVVYKPRSLAVDRHFAVFLCEASLDSCLGLRIPRHLDRGGYGWVEFVEHLSCADEADVGQYYRRLGGLLAVLHVLEASDFHYENIIACGPHPMLIDLEVIYHPRMPSLGTEANEDTDDTVLRTGLLPRKITIGDSAGADISGMTDVAGQEGVVERLALVQGDDGSFSFKRERGTLLGAQNVPVLNGEKVAPSAVLAASLKAGFAEAYAAMMARKDELTAVVDRFADDVVRVLFRPTITYTHLLDEARHPACLLSDDAARQHLENLHRHSKTYPALAQFVEDEIEALRRRDVPVFTCSAGGVDLVIDGRRVIEGFFPTSGVDAVRDRLARLSDEDMQRQCWVIERAMEIAETAIQVAERGGVARPQVKSPASRECDDALVPRLLAQADLVARLIADEIYEDGDRASWLVVKATTEHDAATSVWNATYDLYSGMPGEILFMDQMARVRGNARCAELADKALRYLDERTTAAAQPITPLGFLGGWGSLLMMNAALGLRRCDDGRYDAAERIVERVGSSDLVARDRDFSLTKGAAGLMLACGSLYAASGSRSALALGRTAFDHLMANRQEVATGDAWRIASSRPLSGLAHGASGFATAFARMFEVTGEEIYRSACLRALDFERTLYVGKERNWLDQRDVTIRQGGERCSMSWAHGAPGIGIARVAVLRAGIKTPAILEDLDNAVASTEAAGLTDSFSIISGNFGRLELPVLAAEHRGEPIGAGARALLAQSLSRLEAYTASLGDGKRPPLGMFNGITGLGYQCLRFARSDVTPSLAALNLTAVCSGSEDPLRIEVV